MPNLPETPLEVDEAGYPAEGVFFEVNGGGNLRYCASDKQVVTLAEPHDPVIYQVAVADMIARLRLHDSYWGRHFTAIDFEPPDPIELPIKTPPWREVAQFMCALFDHKWTIEEDRIAVHLTKNSMQPNFRADWLEWHQWPKAEFTFNFRGDCRDLLPQLFVSACLYTPEPILDYIRERGTATAQRYRIKQFVGVEYGQLACSVMGYATSISKRPSINAPLRSRAGRSKPPLSILKRTPMTALRDRILICPVAARGFPVPERVVTRYRGSIVVL